MSFQLVGISFEPFAALFSLSAAALAAHNAQRVIAIENPGYPCRVSLADADIGEELLLLPYTHQPAASPYQASGPIFVRKAARPARLAADVMPDYVLRRQMSVRAYDTADMIIEATVCDGTDAASAVSRMFENSAAAYIHLHNAKRGCFSCRVNRG